MKYTTLVAVFLFLSPSYGENQRLCGYSYSNETLSSTNDENQDLSLRTDSTVETCTVGSSSCFALWNLIVHPDNSTAIVILRQGCWQSSGTVDCPVEICAPLKKEANAGKFFCCCTSDLCNTNISLNPVVVDVQNAPTIIPTDRQPPGRGIGKMMLAFFLGLSLVFIISLCFFWKKSNVMSRLLSHKTSNCQPTQSSNVLLTQQSINNNFPPPDFKFNKVVGQGRYGTVWLGSIGDEPVAVKIFPPHYSHYYFNEKDIYTLPFMEHPSLLTYFGCDESMKTDGKVNYSLFLSYCPNGTLQDYLRSETIDLLTMCKMGSSAALGLAFLHTEIRKGDMWKPCVAHRDLNTKNILVKSDLSCCICDLGLGVKITGSHYYNLGEEQHAETKSINEVGTLRYMAPEVLEGAVNLRDCESSMKQIDVYAFGLVLWELASRTHDLYNKGPQDVPPYTLPFEKQVGFHPTLEQMQTAVCRNKARPLFNSEWKHSSNYGRLIKETIEDSTDQDGEARLTALCIHERLSQIYKGLAKGSGVSPQVNGAGGFPSTIQTNYIGNHNNTLLVENIRSADREGFSDGGGSEGVVSEGTFETVLTLSPSEPFVQTHSSQYSNNDFYMPLQPYHGRNPCMERNLLSGDVNEECPIVQTSRKHKKKEEESLILCSRNETHVQSRISYVQNRPFSLPKECNSSSNGTTNNQISSVLSKPFKKFLKKNSKQGRVIVSPFQAAHDMSLKKKDVQTRPSCLQLSPIRPDNKITMRIKTPGDLPPSVRKKRGSQLRLSLYDDRMMSGLSSEDIEETQTIISLPVSSINSPQL